MEREKFGRIAFVKNGKYLGVAFEDSLLKRDLLYPAIAPIYSNHTFEIINPVPEDWIVSNLRERLPASAALCGNS